MKLLKPDWINHEGRPIFSVDIHPDGSRLVTGGQGNDSGRIVIWSMAPVISEEDEHKENVPKMLCQMDNHLACVNCVRWSANGKFLASGGDDKVIIIWSLGARYAGGGGAFGGMPNVEQWRCVTTLRGHSGDILDLSWSPADNWLASCSVDNTVVIWNTLKWPETVSILKGHTGLVKGISWDPIGKYIASQSDDKTLRIWRVSDWIEETVVTEPFTECGGTTHVLRLSWSPDGQFLVSAHAMNNSGSVAQIIERQDWKTNRDFVGHRKAITCVRFNPNIMCMSNEENSKTMRLCCTAIGSRDRSLSVWLTSRKRPLVVLHDLFDNSVLDISWSQSGYHLVACSWDGTIAFIEFDESEVGKPMSCDEKVLYKQKLYGKSLQSSSPGHLLIEDPEMMMIQEQKKHQNQNGGHQSGSNGSSSKMATSDSKSTASTTKLSKGPTDKQIEIRLADGRRRITPLYIPPLDGVATPFNSQPTTFSSSSEAKTKIIIEKHDESNSSMNAPTTTTPEKPPVKQNKTPSNTNKVPSPQPNENADAAPVQNSINNTNNNNTNNYQNNHQSHQKRKNSPTDLPSHKRKPGRPPVSLKDTPKQTSAVAQTLTPTDPQTKVSDKRASNKVEGRSSPTSHFQLPPLKMDKTLSVPILNKNNDKDIRTILEVENNISSCSICALRLTENEERKWEVLMSTRICGVASNEQLIAAACDDNTLSVFNTSTGRRLQPPIVINSLAARLTCYEYYIMLITTKAVLWMWDFSKHRVIIKAESLLPLFSGTGHDVSILTTGITDSGSPLVCLSNGKSYVFNEHFSTWTVIANSNDLLNSCTDQKPHSFDPSSLPLNIIQSQQVFHKSVHSIFSSNASLQQSGALSFIDQQLAASFVIASSKEYRFWLLALAQHLVHENMEPRLRELCHYLIGPLFKSSKSVWDPKILGNDKHELLKEVLSIMTSNLRLQRLYNEFKEQFDLLNASNQNGNKSFDLS